MSRACSQKVKHELAKSSLLREESERLVYSSKGFRGNRGENEMARSSLFKLTPVEVWSTGV